MGGLAFSDRAARSMWRMVPKRAVSGAIGWGVGLGIPARLRTLMLTRFARSYDIDITEAEKPIGEYAGFDEFFTRKLRPGARPIDDPPGRVVSPADGTVVECGLATAGKLIQAKGSEFDLASLLADEDAAARLQGGASAADRLLGCQRADSQIHLGLRGGLASRARSRSSVCRRRGRLGRGQRSPRSSRRHRLVRRGRGRVARVLTRRAQAAALRQE